MEYNYDKIVGNRIRELREKKYFTQDQMAAKLQVMGCDLTRSAVAKIEVGQRHIYLHELKCIRAVLNCKYEDLLI